MIIRVSRAGGEPMRRPLLDEPGHGGGVRDERPGQVRVLGGEQAAEVGEGGLGRVAGVLRAVVGRHPDPAAAERGGPAEQFRPLDHQHVRAVGRGGERRDEAARPAPRDDDLASRHDSSHPALTRASASHIVAQQATPCVIRNSGG
jgi:hypothetical protein